MLQGAQEFAFCDTSVAAGWPHFYQTNTHTLEGSQAFLLSVVLEPQRQFWVRSGGWKWQRVRVNVEWVIMSWFCGVQINRQSHFLSADCSEGSTCANKKQKNKLNLWFRSQTLFKLCSQSCNICEVSYITYFQNRLTILAHVINSFLSWRL